MIDLGFPGGPSQYLRNENTRLKNENEKLKKANADLMTQTGVKAYIAKADAKVEQEKKNNIRILGFWESTKEDLASSESKNKDLRQQNKKLKDENRKLNATVKSLEKDNAYKARQIETLTKKNTEMAAELESSNRKVKELGEKLQKELDKVDVAGRGNGIPTSQTPIGRAKIIPHIPREKKQEHRGGVEGHPGRYLAPLDESRISKRIPHPCTKKLCDKCNVELQETGRAEVRDFTDLITITVGVRHEFQVKICPCCGKEYHESIPAGLKYPNNYGPNMKAQLVWNMVIGNVPMNKNSRFAAGVSNGDVTPSDGYMAKLLRQGAELLKPFMFDLRIAEIGQSLLYWDDTVIWINKSRACLRFYGNEHMAFYAAHEHKDAKSLDDDGILQFLTVDTNVEHDHNMINYNEKYRFTNVECVVHAQREGFKYILIAHRKEAERFVSFISETIAARKQLISQNVSGFDSKKIESLFKELDTILLDWKAASEKDVNRYFQHDELVFIERIMKYREEYFAWIRDFSLPTSNSLSERALRIAKSKTKISGQFYSEETAGFYATLLSYVETCHRNGINELDALVKLYSGNPYSVQEIIPKEYLRNFDEVKRIVRKAEGSENTQDTDVNDENRNETTDNSNTGTSVSDDEPVDPLLGMNRQAIVELAMQKILEGLDKESTQSISESAGQNSRELEEVPAINEDSTSETESSQAEVIDDESPEIYSPMAPNQKPDIPTNCDSVCTQDTAVAGIGFSGPDETGSNMSVSNPARGESLSDGKPAPDKGATTDLSVVSDAQEETLSVTRSLYEEDASTAQLAVQGETLPVGHASHSEGAAIDPSNVPDAQGETMPVTRQLHEDETSITLPAAQGETLSVEHSSHDEGATADPSTAPNIQGETLPVTRQFHEEETSTALPAVQREILSVEHSSHDEGATDDPPAAPNVQGETMPARRSLHEAEDSSDLQAQTAFNGNSFSVVMALSIGAENVFADVLKDLSSEVRSRAG